MIGTLAVDGWAVTLLQRGAAWAGPQPQPAQAPPRCTKCNSPPINGQCTNFVLFDVAPQLPLKSKGLKRSMLRRHCDKKYHNSLAVYLLSLNIRQTTSSRSSPVSPAWLTAAPFTQAAIVMDFCERCAIMKNRIRRQSANPLMIRRGRRFKRSVFSLIYRYG